MKQFESLDFCPELVRIYSAGYVVSPSGKRFDTGGCSTVNNLLVLRNVFRSLRPRRTMEVGLAFGGSCLTFAALHQEAGAETRRQHVAIDPFQTSVWERLGILAVERAGLAGYVEVREELSCLQLPKMVEHGEEYGMVYVDGSHLFEDVFVDAYFACRLLSEGGIMLFDDCRIPQVKKAIRFLRSNMTDCLEDVDLGPFREDQGRSLKYRAARALNEVQMTAFKRIGPAARKWDASFHDF
jgi:predicted O-methyltransferase YrrM